MRFLGGYELSCNYDMVFLELLSSSSYLDLYVVTEFWKNCIRKKDTQSLHAYY
jgi:hypothetical protein